MPATPKPSVTSASRPVPTAPSSAPGLGRVPVAKRAPANAWPEESAPSPPPAPASVTRPSVQTPPRAVPAAPSPAPAPSPATPKPQDDDKIGPVGTAYTPIKLTPKRLVNPFAARQAQAQEEDVPPKKQPTAGKKLTWSERQALAKKQADEEESKSRAASFHSQPAAPAWKQPAAATPEPEEEEWEVCYRDVTVVGYAHTDTQAPAPPPPPPAATRPVPVAVAAAPPPPPPPPPTFEPEPEYEEPAAEEFAPPPPVSTLMYLMQLKPKGHR